MGGIDVRDALVISVTDQALEGLPAKIALDLAAVAACAEPQAAQRDPGSAQGHLVRCRALDSGRVPPRSGSGDGQQDRAARQGGALFEKCAAIQ